MLDFKKLCGANAAIRGLVLMAGLGMTLAGAHAQAAPAAMPAAPATGAKGTLVVGVKVAPPFVIKDGDSYSGLAVQMWKKAAADHHWTYRFKQYDLEGLLDAVGKGEIAAGLGAITATAQREQHMDFSHVLVSSGLGIAVSGKQGAGWLAIARALTSGPFISAVIGLLILLLIVGILVWIFEFRQESQQFSHNPIRGIGAGLWWAAVTATTVGYGDKSPETVGGRIIGMIWMFAALIAVAAFTATITSVLTVGNLSGRVRGPEDLPHVRVASIHDTTSSAWLAQNNISYVAEASPEKALKALAAGKVDAVVYDAPLLNYLISQGDGSGKLRLLPQTPERQDYVIVLPRHSPLRKPLNESILKLLADPQWQTQWAAMRSGGV